MKSGQRGITLIETVGALAIGSLMLIGLTALMDSALDDTKGQQAALHQAQVTAAARKYINANYDALLTKTPAPASVAAIDVAELKTKKFLPDSFALNNVYGQSVCVLVRQPVAGSKKLEALVATTGGRKIEDKYIAVVAEQAGQGGGYIKDSDFANAQGASWRMSTTNYRNVACPGGGPSVLTGGQVDGGHLVSSIFYDGPGQLATDFLYRNEILGRPDLNTMNTPVRLADKGIATEGNDCTIVPAGGGAAIATAAVAADANNNLLRCGDDGKWTAVTTWKGPVETYASLPATDKRGDVRMTMDKGRAYMYDGSTWIALAVDQFGDLRVERDVLAGRDIRATGDMYARDVNASRTVLAGHDVGASHDVFAGNDIRSGRDIKSGRDVTARDISASRDITAQNNIRAMKTVRGYEVDADTIVQAQELYLVDPSYKAGDKCNIPTYDNGQLFYILPTGTVVRDQNGLVLVCAIDQTLRYPNGKYTP